MIATNKHGRKLKTYDEWGMSDGATLYVCCHEFGAFGVIRARTWHDAWESMIDEIMDPIPVDEIPEAYGFETLEGLECAHALEGEHPDLIEGYEYMPNAGGTSGIVNVGEYVNIFELREDHEIEVTFPEDEDDE